ncbi:sigma-70 family RNA polymerase sigma factor [Aquirufa nivalisilvae]|uniref:RNA polymerase sigma factor n=1 Tax=Aquirufa nivalisilvae TaxID=2516557 RepID=UPI0022A96A96|nr:sigma-70 family RNA polymerase sigma factor [Aquirufa nivalisilvae]MCZ2482301.1 sigma-70 family RNA polymerase sigma factor [Aquirufa nivalisilvae]
MKQSINEVEVWDQFRNGNHQAFTSLYQHFVQPLYSYSMGITSDKELIKDCLHDLFVELWRNHASLGPTTSVKFYLMASIKRKLVRHLDGQLKNAQHHANYYLETADRDNSQEYRMIRMEDELATNKQLSQCLLKLSKRQREAISLKFYHNMDTDQISQSMKINPQSVYNLIFGALRQMKELMVYENVAF